MLLENAVIHFFYCLSHILSYIYKYHIFFIHPSDDGHFSFFNMLVTLKSAAVKLGCMSLQIMVFLRGQAQE